MNSDRLRRKRFREQQPKCSHKVRYYTVIETYKEIERLNELNDPKRYEAYWCWVCNFYHIGSIR